MRIGGIARWREVGKWIIVNKKCGGRRASVGGNRRRLVVLTA